MSNELADYLSKLTAAENKKTVSVDIDGSGPKKIKPGDVGLAGYALAAELAALTNDLDGQIAAIHKHREYAPESFTLVLYAAILNLIEQQVEPAFKLLDGSSYDRRVRAKKEWAVLTTAAN